ncbi:MAG: hypothetical protein ACYTEQ_07015 [Planctomycetota bacterium]
MGGQADGEVSRAVTAMGAYDLTTCWRYRRDAYAGPVTVFFAGGR